MVKKSKAEATTAIVHATRRYDKPVSPVVGDGVLEAEGVIPFVGFVESESADVVGFGVTGSVGFGVTDESAVYPTWYCAAATQRLFTKSRPRRMTLSSNT